MLFEVMVFDWMLQYFEYYDILEVGEEVFVCDYMLESGQSNLFFYLLMYLLISEQVLVDQLCGIWVVYEVLVQWFDLLYEVQYQVMECLGQMLWMVQCIGLLFDGDVYIECVCKCVIVC